MGLAIWSTSFYWLQLETYKGRGRGGGCLCPVASATGHVVMQTHAYSWTCVRILTCAVAIGHWT